MEGRVIKVVGCCGIPGVGKSVALKRLKRSGALQAITDQHFEDSPRGPPLYIFVPEPVKEWKTNGWIQAYYDNPDQEAACFQWLVFDSHVRAIEAAIEAAPKDRDLVIVQERTMYDQRLFWEQQVELGYRTATPRYNQAYLAIWQRWRRFVPEPNVLLFFQTTDIQQTMQRVKRRARVEEMGGSFSESDMLKQSTDALASGEPILKVGGLTLEYQLKLLDLHKAWFEEPVARPPGAPESGVPCVHVNADGPYHEDDAHLVALAQRIADIVIDMFEREKRV